MASNVAQEGEPGMWPQFKSQLLHSLLMCQVLGLPGSAQPSGRPRLSSRLLTLARPRPGCCTSLGGETMQNDLCQSVYTSLSLVFQMRIKFVKCAVASSAAVPAPFCVAQSPCRSPRDGGLPAGLATGFCILHVASPVPIGRRGKLPGP